MGRLIDADKLQRELEESGYRDDYILSQMLDEQPTVEAAPVVHGRWEPAFGQSYQCSICCHWIYHRKNFCPHCGAKMDLEEV